MTHKQFTYKELLRFGWEKTKEYFLFLLSLTLIYIVVMGVTMYSPILNNIFSTLLSIAFTAIGLMIVAGKVPDYKDLLTPFKNYKVLWHYILATIVYALIVLVGFLLLILPGIYLAVRLQFYMYLVVEHENMGPIEALKKSMKMTEGIFWKLFGFGLVIGIINLIGFLLLGIGLLVTLPLSGIAYTYLYKKLESAHTHIPATA